MTTVDPQRAVAYIQERGLGNPWQSLPAETNIQAISGGGSSFESDFAQGQYIGTRKTSNPERLTGTIEVRRATTSKIRELASKSCMFTLGIFYGCKPISLLNFDFGTLYVDVGVTSSGTSDVLVDGTEGIDPKVMDTLDFSAATGIEVRPLSPTDVSGEVAEFALNDIIPIGVERCPGICGDYRDGAEEWLAVGDSDGVVTTPNILYSSDKGGSWTIATIAAITNGAATSVALVNDRVIVTAKGTTNGIYIAPLESVKAGLGTDFSLAAGVGATAADAFNKVVAIDHATAIAVGDNGKVVVSTDGGYSWTRIFLSGPTSTATVHSIAVIDRNMIYVGGIGLLNRIRNLSFSQNIDLTGISSPTILCMDSPPNRPNEVYFGTSGGAIYRIRNAYAATPLIEAVNFDKPSGGSSIRGISFGGTSGAVMFVLQVDSTPASRVMVDYSGGAGGSWMIATAPFSSAVQITLNALAAAGANFALAVGEEISSYGTILKVAG
jgi:hypothetical protein